MEANTPSEAPPSPPPRLLTIREVADLTRLSVPTIRAAERRGLLPAIRLVGRIRFREADVAAFIATGENAPRRRPPPEVIEASRRRR